MGSPSICEICGNEVDPLLTSCPFCNERRTPKYKRDNIEQIRVVNLEKGMPLVQDALRFLESELEIVSQDDVKIFVLIHGYGSSGEGGAIKEAVRRRLQFLLDKKRINDVLPGEKCGKHSAHARYITKRFPFSEEYTLRVNPGITIVIL